MARPRDVFLHPGDFFFSGVAAHVRTLLGSCVSITLWHPRLRVGGMCHYVIPRRRRSLENQELDGRYADEAMQLFLREVQRHGTRPSEYDVRMVGGGNQFPRPEDCPTLNIPRQNIDAGLRLLDDHGFHLAGRHLGGTGSRRVHFDLSTGEVSLEHIDHPGPRGHRDR